MAALRILVLNGGILVLVLAPLGCVEEPRTLLVMSRLGDLRLTGLPAGGAKIERVRLEAESRWALCVAPGSSFQVALEAGVERVHLSVGLRSPQASSVHFEIRGEAGSAVFSETIDGQTTSWRDTRLDLGAAEGDRVLTFDTVTDSPSAAGHRARKLRKPACWGSVAFLGLGETPSPARPNVILISLDTLGAAYLNAFDHPHARSPRIDAFLADSYSFEKAFVQFGNTLISHRSIFTSRYPSRQKKQAQTPDSLAEVLGRHGYVTAAITENAFVGSAFGFARGFDRFVDSLGSRGSTPVRRDAARTFRGAADWLERFGTDSRFFLFVHTYEVHEPHLPRDAAALALANAITPDDTRTFDGRVLERWVAWHNSGERLLSTRDIRRLAAFYLGQVLYLDGAWGQFVDRLEELGLAQNTLVVLTSDHGQAFGEQGKLGHGKTLHNRVLHVPLAFHWPGKIKPTTGVNVVQSVDIKPSVLGLAGIKMFEVSDGRDLSRLLLGDVAELPSRPAFAEMVAQDWNSPARPRTCEGGAYTVQTERYKLVSCKRTQGERFYDLVTDPEETRDAAGANPRELERLRALLIGYRTHANAAEPIAPQDIPADVDDATREQLRALGYLE
jgi:arylsulfatase A-like enzyme